MSFSLFGLLSFSLQGYNSAIMATFIEPCWASVHVSFFLAFEGCSSAMLATLFGLYWATLLLATLAGVAHIHMQGCQCIISELGNSLLHLGSRRTWGSPVDR